MTTLFPTHNFDALNIILKVHSVGKKSANKSKQRLSPAWTDVGSGFKAEQNSPQLSKLLFHISYRFILINIPFLWEIADTNKEEWKSFAMIALPGLRPFPPYLVYSSGLWHWNFSVIPFPLVLVLWLPVLQVTGEIVQFGLSESQRDKKSQKGYKNGCSCLSVSYSFFKAWTHSQHSICSNATETSKQVHHPWNNPGRKRNPGVGPWTRPTAAEDSAWIEVFLQKHL